MANLHWQSCVGITKSNYKVMQDKTLFEMIWNFLRRNNKTLEESIHFTVQPELTFFENDTSVLEKVEDGQNIYFRLWVHFMGLIGAYGHLPAPLRENVLTQSHQRDESLLLLYDFLQQRALQLCYEAWCRRRTYTYTPLQQTAPLCQSLSAISGMDISHPQQRDACGVYLRYFSSHFANPQRPIAALQQILTTVLRQPIHIDNPHGAWITLDTQNRGQQLGHNTLLGSRMWSAHAVVYIIIGPIRPFILHDWLPNGNLYRLLQQLLLRYIEHRCDWVIQLRVDNQSIQASQLSHVTWNQLGQACFLTSRRQAGVNHEMTLRSNRSCLI